MKLTPEQLLFLIQVLKDSLNVDKTSSYAFKESLQTRKKFYDDLVETALKELRAG